MGLLSSRTFRQIAIGAAGRYQEKRQTMRDRIDEYRERAVNTKNDIQTKYNEYFDEEKENINTFNQLSTLVGADYVGKLNSFAQGNPDKLNLFLNQNANTVRAELDKYQDSDSDFVAQRTEKLKLKENELNQNLQDQVGLFKGTSTLFTRDLEERGMKEIQAESGTLQTQTLPSVQAAGPGMGTDTFIGQEKISSNIDYYNNTLKIAKVDPNTKLPVLDNDGNQVYTIAKGQESTVANIDNLAQTSVENGFNKGLDQAIGNVIEALNNQNYEFSFMTTAIEGSPIDVELTQLFNEAKIQNKPLSMQSVIDELRERGLTSKADMFQKELDDFTTQKIDEEPEPETETTTTTTQPTEDIPGTKIEGAGSRAKSVTEDYVSPEQKDANSKVQVTEDFIKQVMDKNNVDRNRAIEILQMYGYTQFPQVTKTETKTPPFLKGKK
tara:strand:+ start:2487 stop:3803 length:1317 start_codon:yes stop_codon:yes gene_type:complete